MTQKQPIIVEQFFNTSIKIIWKAITDITEMRQWFFNNIDDFFVEKIHLKYRLTLHYLGNVNC